MANEYEAMRPFMVRVKDKHRVMVKKLAKKSFKKEAHIVREAIEEKFRREG